ncbi:hypothetical protein PoB_006909200 [Plakobranchus ocellatus]|uniref:Uncharacterized protein n=1 Tax=Plakobranchus ocellatus TaxID=259542 RepID=A0AAV4DEB7_9GAST|nr:hypothetical protein PoB_006909200 [Plakobranchus ocellatus]
MDPLFHTSYRAAVVLDYCPASGPPSGQGAGGLARTRDRRVPANLRTGLLSTLPPTPLSGRGRENQEREKEEEEDEGITWEDQEL